jgi:hypothetical protein
MQILCPHPQGDHPSIGVDVLLPISAACAKDSIHKDKHKSFWCQTKGMERGCADPHTVQNLSHFLFGKVCFFGFVSATAGTRTATETKWESALAQTDSSVKMLDRSMGLPSPLVGASHAQTI